MKAVLIAIAVFVAFDALAWGGAVRHEVVEQFLIAAHEIGGLSWAWG
jgi:hypothetical protein